MLMYTDGDPHAAIAERIGTSAATVGRWGRVGRPPAEWVIKIARAYEADPVRALLAAGYLTSEDFMGGGLRSAVAHAPLVYLTDEVHKRVLRMKS